ncbi:biotin--[acetyl-CoA-carboxylase] ligase [Melioribacteraceae bacterium 4301-Me]|uniref:biotin--[acetyl-CoA-carboxylase] ligase n=1 Tax=Pyranulibacter aquaticus TaxID=3163344 RepID=UPI0035967CA5
MKNELNFFNIEEFDIKLDTEFIGRNFIYCDEVDSTNKLLLESNEFNQNGTVVLAEYQSSGKGRRERTWVSNNGQNLTFSILLKDFTHGKKINLFNLAASLAVSHSIENLYQLKVELKWPNDVLINRKKVAGILLESTSKGNKIEKLVIGIGVNVNQTNFPGKFDIPPTSIRKEFKEIVSRERLLSEILNNYEALIANIKYEPEKILNDWKMKCNMIGEKVKITDGKESKYGIFEDIDQNGFLILKTGDKIETIHFGDVSLR